MFTEHKTVYTDCMAKLTIKSGTIIKAEGVEIEVLAAHSQPLSPVKWENGWLIRVNGIGQTQFCDVRNMKRLIAHASEIVAPIESGCGLSDDDLLAELAA